MQEIYISSSSTGALFGDKVRCLGMLGVALGRAGQTAEGIARIDEALIIARTITKLPDLCDLNFIKGQLYLMQKPSGIRKARQCFSMSIQIAREMGAKADELTAVMGMAKLLARQGAASKHARCSRKSTAGSPKGSTPPT
jgi:hypothetical protein